MNIKSNIDYYMNLKGIKMYSCLLLCIAHELGITGQDAYEFVEKEKSNFSKMLNGKRPLKYEFIIPLEKIFGVSLARILDENAYKLPVEKDNVPFNKGFRYYAYLDNMELYKNEFDLLLAKDGSSIITQTDEFGKTFLDYIVEYHSINGVRYLYEEYGIKLRWPFRNNFDLRKNKESTWVNFDNLIDFARLVASMNDECLFYNIFDSYHMFFTNGHYGGKNVIFYNDNYLEIILDNDTLFNYLLETRIYERVVEKRKKEPEHLTYNTVNPIINNCLHYALQHLDKYKQRAKEMLNFGIDYNKQKLNEINIDDYYMSKELGGLISNKDGGIKFALIIIDVEINDYEISLLAEKLSEITKGVRKDEIYRGL